MKKAGLLIIIVIAAFAVYFFIKNKPNVGDEVIDEAGPYVLEMNKSEYFNTLFKELKKTYDAEYSESDLAIIISKLFIADVYSLHYAQSKNDVHGVQFVDETYKADFIKIAKASLYDHVENNMYNTRKQELPVVTDVEIVDIETNSFDFKETEVEVFEIEVAITYKKDMGYSTSAKLYVYVNENKAEILKMD